MNTNLIGLIALVAIIIFLIWVIRYAVNSQKQSSATSDHDTDEDHEGFFSKLGIGGTIVWTFLIFGMLAIAIFILGRIPTLLKSIDLQQYQNGAFSYFEKDLVPITLEKGSCVPNKLETGRWSEPLEFNDKKFDLFLGSDQGTKLWVKTEVLDSQIISMDSVDDLHILHYYNGFQFKAVEGFTTYKGNANTLNICLKYKK
jgi:hypothetical protein